MCLILLAWRSHHEYPCVIAANRDEFFARPARAAHWWSGQPDTLAGQDLKAGGTWLGVTRQGRFAALTNYRGAKAVDAASRGLLVSQLLGSKDTVTDLLRHLSVVSPDYPGFNVIFSDGEHLGVYESVPNTGRELPPGIYGLSNHLLDTPWPKVVQAKSRLSRALTELPSTDALLDLLRDDTPAPDHLLPRTGVNLEWERLLSSAFIRSEDYGTRCSSVFFHDRQRAATFLEWTWGNEGESPGEVRVEFTLQ
jgi:uncharacterized protein with NRDE domain